MNFQVLRRTVATHLQGIGSVKDIQFALRHTKPQMAQEEYVQPVESSIRSTVEKLAALLRPSSHISRLLHCSQVRGILSYLLIRFHYTRIVQIAVPYGAMAGKIPCGIAL